MGHLELAVFRVLIRQKESVCLLEDGYYVVDLIREIVEDPRIADADLDLVAYKKLFGDAEWAALLEKHAKKRKTPAHAGK